MKQSFILLITLIFSISAWQLYHKINKDTATEKHNDGVLSDIAEEVVAIPLQTPSGMEPIKYARNISKQGDNLFLVSRNTLFLFNRKGEFIRQITNPDEISVAGYMINEGKKEIIVLGNKDDIHYYNFSGKLLKKKKLKSDLPQQNVMSAVLYNNRIYTSERKQIKDSIANNTRIVDCVVEYDTSFNKIGEKKLCDAENGRKHIAPNYHRANLMVNKDSGIIYAYKETSEPESLLRDSLYIFNNDGHRKSDENIISSFPVQLGTRYWISSHTSNSFAEKNNIFCLDVRNNEAWQIKDGFTDDFFLSGRITNLYPSDIYCHTYSFFKSGDALKSSFPENAESNNAVIFIVRMKS